MDASTKMPKSIAPIEIRFAEWPVSTIIENANSTANGIVRRSDKGGSQIAQHQQQNQRDQHQSTDDYMLHRMCGLIDETRTVIDRADVHAWRQQ